MSNVLGRGLDALLSSQVLQPFQSETTNEQTETTETGKKESVRSLSICEIFPNPRQPRKSFNNEKLDELTDSIRENGILQPVIVRRRDDDQFELIAGERRWRAAQRAGLEKLPAIIRDIPDNDILKWALIENIQRDDLNPIEEALAYQQLLQGHNLTQDDVAKSVGKKRSTITNSLRLLNLAPPVRKSLIKEEITMGHAKALLSLPTAEEQERFLREILSRNWSVREVERFIHTYKKKTKKPVVEFSTDRDPFIHAIEAELMELLGTKVTVNPSKKGGRIEVHYYSNDDLDRLLLLMRNKNRVAA